MKFLLTAVLTVAPLLTSVAQSPWVTDPKIPNLYSSGTYLFNQMLSTPQPGTLWMMCTRFVGRSTNHYYVVRTKDNGQNWNTEWVTTGVGKTLSAPSGGYHAQNLYALDGETAWRIDQDASVDTHYRLLKTTDGPEKFSVVAATLPAAFSQVFFFNTTTGVAVAPSAANSPWQLYRTTDAGATWTLIANTPVVSAAGADQILEPSANYGRIGGNLWFGTVRGAILHTADLGLTWTTKNSGLALTGVTFQDTQHGLAFGFAAGSVTEQSKADQLLRTTDGGQTWVPVVTRGPLQANTLTYVPGSAGTYISCGSHYSASAKETVLSFSTDNGTTWQAISAGTSNNYDQLSASSPDQIWVSAHTDVTGNPYVINQRMLLRYAGPALITGVTKAKAIALALYPNPAAGIVQLPAPAVGNETLCLSDLAGRTQQTIRLTRGQRQLNLSGQAAGIYQVVLTSADGQRRTQKLVLNPY